MTATAVPPRAAGTAQLPSPPAPALGRLRSFVGGFAAGRNSVFERALCTAVVYALAHFVLLVPGVSVTHWPPVIAGAITIAVATVAARALGRPRTPSPWAVTVPLAGIVAVGLMRVGTGGVSSLFTIMIVLPVVSLGVEPRRWPLVLGGLVTVPTLLLPLVYDRSTFADGQWVRIFFTPLILGLTALSVNELSTRLRSRVRAVQALRRQQDRLLEEATLHVAASEAASIAARDSTRQLINVIDSVTEQAIIATDSSGAIEVFNAGAQKMLHLAAHDVLGRSIEQFTGRGDGRWSAVDLPEPAHFDDLVAGVVDGSASVSDRTLVTADGHRLRAQVTVTPRGDVAGQPDGYLFVATDVTSDREQARLKDDFVNLISHELRTPLSSILGYLELLADDDEHPLSAEQSEFVGVIDRNAHRLLRLVSDLLFTAQVEAGRFDLQGQPVDLGQVIDASIDTALPQAGSKNITLRTFMPPQPVTLWGDPTRLGQAMDNLVSNAIKFTPRDGRVAVTLTVTDGPEPQALVCVTDTGLGIPAAELDRLFSRFFRASTATDNAVPGVGLGLNITKAIVTAHHGRITVASTVNEGTTFAIELPLPRATSAD